MTPAEYLDHSRVYRGADQFAVGTFERGITFYNQQIRALNLIYSMREAKTRTGTALFKPGTKVAIVGGGAFGITAAAAATWVGYDVWLLERCQVLLPVQRGCDTRWLHPHFYNWPRPGADDPQAHLPLLDWRAGTAGNVAEQVETAFHAHQRQVKRAGVALNVLLGATEITVINEKQGSEPFKVSWRTLDGHQDIRKVGAIIYSLGFGVERAANVPYWRNDSLAQIDLHSLEKKRFLISGVGDGGLTDLFRLSISNFKHERIFHELFDGLDEVLTGGLREIISDAEKAPSRAEKAGWLHDRFQQLENNAATADHFRNVLEKLDSRRRKDTSIEVNGHSADCRASLSLRRTALKNALLTYMLHRRGAFSYRVGKLIPNDRKFFLSNGDTEVEVGNGQEVIVRHGTDRTENLTSELGFSKRAIESLKAKGQANTGRSIYEPQWWAAKAYKQGKDLAPTWLLPQTTSALATMFITTLSDILQDGPDQVRSDNDLQFRLTLHRLIMLGTEEHFQQLTPYAGLKAKSDGLGRLFPTSSGIIGMACRTGKPIVVKRSKKTEWQQAWNLMHFNALNARPIRAGVETILACPFFAPRTGPKDRVCLVLFADSNKRDFFNQSILHTIYAACRGFVTNLERMRRTSGITEVTEAYFGYAVEETKKLARLIDRLKKLNVQFDNAEFAQYKSDLTFEKMRSLNLTFGNTISTVS